MSAAKAIGVIGAGKIVENSHLPVLTTLPGVKVRWITDQSVPRARLLSAMYGIKPIELASLSNAIEEIDVLLLAIPLGTRGPYFDLAAKTNKALYVEKPFARSWSDHVSFESKFKPERIAAGFQRRTYSSIRMLKRAIEDQRFGKLRQIRLAASDFDLKSGGDSSFITKADQAGGGVLIESAIHFLDQIVYVAQVTTIHVATARALVSKKVDYEVRCECTIDTLREDSRPVELFVSRLRNEVFRFEFTFDHAVVSVPRDPASPLRILGTPDKVGSIRTLENTQSSTNKVKSIDGAFFEFWRLFLEGIERGVSNETSASSSRMTSAWVGAIYEVIEKRAADERQSA